MTSIKLDVDVHNLEEVQRKIGAMPINKALRDAMLKSAIFVENLVVRFSPTDTGRFVGSVGHRVEGVGSGVVGIIGSNVQGMGTQQVEYTPFVEEDTRPHWPPLDAVRTWAERHGMTAYQVARSIAMKGTTGYHMFKQGAEAGQKKVQDFFEEAIADLVRRL